MTLVSASVLCFIVGYFKDSLCNAMGSYGTECNGIASYSTTLASFSAAGALILFSLVYMGVLAMPRGGYGMGGYGMGSMGMY